MMARRTRSVALIGALLMFAAPAGAQSIPDVYADSLTAALVATARERHQRRDSLVENYQALVRTRMDAGAGASRFARTVPILAHETAARVTWRRPDQLKLEVLGVRSRSALGGVDADVFFGRPWFIPGALGDSIRLMGVPETAALHPLAPGAEGYYRYAVRDSVIMRIPGRTVRAVAVRVEPRRLGPSLVAGDIWVDALSGDVVRLTVTFLGEYLWETPDTNATRADSAAARGDNRWAQRFVSVQVDLEYALYENLYWMPYRQLLQILVEWDILFRGALPVRAVTTIDEYRINSNAPIAFVVPLDADERRTRRVYRHGGAAGADSTSRDRRLGFDRAGRSGVGHWEISYPPADSLRAYEWPDALSLDLTPEDRDRIRDAVADLARVTEALPDSWMGRPRHSVQWERFADIARYNRVQGPSVGIGYEFRPGPAFTTLYAGARFGISDQRPTGKLAWRRDGPGGLLEIAAWRAVHEAEPWTDGQSFGNSLSTLFAGHDEADYHLALGGGVTFRGYRGLLEGTALTLAAERHRSMEVAAGWIGGDAAEARPNPLAAEADLLRLAIVRDVRAGSMGAELGVEGMAGADLAGARGWLRVRAPFSVLGRTGALTLRAGRVAGDAVPQLLFRVGGIHTVRGYPYGFRGGDALWSAQLDWALLGNWLISPVVFTDAGGVFASDDPLVSVGAGVSVFGGLIRANFAKGVRPSEDVRFDVLFRAPR